MSEPASIETVAERIRGIADDVTEIKGRIDYTPQDEDQVFFRVQRDPADGGDNLAVDARLHGITVYITTAADTDA